MKANNSKVAFLRVLPEYSIRREITPPDVQHYNKVAKRALGLLQEKCMAVGEM